MNKNILSCTAAAAALISAHSAQGALTAYAIADNGFSLISFSLATPGVTTFVGSFGGAVSRIDGLDFRPADGLLYGYSQQSNSVVTINLSNAGTTLASNPGTGSTTPTLGIDFNPVPDRLRLVNESDQNLRINADTGATLVDGTLAYAAGDPNFGVNPSINEAAYTNSDTDPGTGTSLFYIDPALDILVSTTNPNGGALNTVGALGVDTSELTGFDILSDGLGGNTAYALLTAQSGTASLYTIDLTTGAATSVGAISQTAGTRPFSLAINPASVPEAGSGTVILGMAFGGLFLSRRRLKAGTPG